MALLLYIMVPCMFSALKSIFLHVMVGLQLDWARDAGLQDIQYIHKLCDCENKANPTDSFKSHLNYFSLDLVSLVVVFFVFLLQCYQPREHNLWTLHSWLISFIQFFYFPFILYQFSVSLFLLLVFYILFWPTTDPWTVWASCLSELTQTQHACVG